MDWSEVLLWHAEARRIAGGVRPVGVPSSSVKPQSPSATTLPWPRSKATVLLPKVSAKDSPMLWLRINMSELSPNVLRISKVGTLLPKKPLM